MRSERDGFSLIELMVVLALAALILSIAAPNFGEFRRNHRMTGIANDFLGATQSARTEAIKRQRPVAVCPSDDPEADAATCSGGPFRGWIAFVDADNDCERDAADPLEEILRAGLRIDTPHLGRPIAAMSNGDCISFAPTGFLQLVPGHVAASRTLFCDDRRNTTQPGTDLSAARGLEITRTGRARVTRDVAAIDTWPIACP
jgi:type IV fimbrial biogenesis protein FimT